MSNNCNPTPNDPCSSQCSECKDIWTSNCLLYVGTPSTCQSYIDIDTDTSMTVVIQTLMAKICDLNERLEAL